MLCLLWTKWMLIILVQTAQNSNNVSLYFGGRWRKNRAEESPHLLAWSFTKPGLDTSSTELAILKRDVPLFLSSFSPRVHFLSTSILMEFRYSEKIDPSTYNIEDDLCIGIDVRSNKDSMGEIRGVTRCDNDWSKLVGPLGNSKGSLADPFSFIRVTMPETLPERLEIVSYASEYAFLYDGMYISSFSLSAGRAIMIIMFRRCICGRHQSESSEFACFALLVKKNQNGYLIRMKGTCRSQPNLRQLWSR